MRSEARSEARSGWAMGEAEGRTQVGSCEKNTTSLSFAKRRMEGERREQCANEWGREPLSVDHSTMLVRPLALPCPPLPPLNP